MKTFVYQNGEYLPANAVGINVFSQTIHYGYGAFEGIRSYLTTFRTLAIVVQQNRNSISLGHTRIDRCFL